MKRLLAPLFCAVFLATVTDALGLAGDLKEPGVAFSQSYPDAARQQVMAALNRPDCKFLKGHFINWHTSLFYAGETMGLNLFLADLAKCDGVTLTVLFTSEPVATEPCDWVVSHDSMANHFAIRAEGLRMQPQPGIAGPGLGEGVSKKSSRPVSGKD
jgi:hypothetical protein